MVKNPSAAKLVSFIKCAFILSRCHPDLSLDHVCHYQVIPLPDGMSVLEIIDIPLLCLIPFSASTLQRTTHRGTLPTIVPVTVPVVSIIVRNTAVTVECHTPPLSIVHELYDSRYLAFR